MADYGGRSQVTQYYYHSRSFSPSLVPRNLCESFDIVDTQCISISNLCTFDITELCSALSCFLLEVCAPLAVLSSRSPRLSRKPWRKIWKIHVFLNQRRNHFGNFGTLADIALMKDKYTGHPRGFGFIKFEDVSGVPSSQGAWLAKWVRPVVSLFDRRLVWAEGALALLN